MSIKLEEKNFLCKYDLDTELFKKFNLKVKDIVPIRKSFIICTDKGTKILKKMDLSIEELKFIYSCLQYINKTFDKTVKFVNSIDNKPYTIWNNDVYCITDIIEGKECEYANPIDLIITSKSLAKFHRASYGITNKINYTKRNYSGKLIDMLKRKKDEMILFKNIANVYQNKNAFDILFLENIDFFIEQIDKSIELLTNSKYLELCKQTSKNVFCHHDLAHHNIIIKGSYDAYFIDFDFSIIDLKVHDLCNFIIKVLKSCYFDVDKVHLILNNYSKFNSLDKEELEVLFALFNFPEDIYSISKDYYTRRKERPLEVNISKLQRKLSFKEAYMDFLRNFELNYI